MQKGLDFIEIPISFSSYIKDDKYILSFNFGKRNRLKKYLLDKRYKIYDSFENKILERIPNIPELEFLIRKDLEDEIRLFFKVKNKVNINCHKNIFVVSGWVPPNAGCEYCRYKEDINNVLFHCEIKNKTLTHEIKNCKVFMQSNYVR